MAKPKARAVSSYAMFAGNSSRCVNYNLFHSFTAIWLAFPQPSVMALLTTKNRAHVHTTCCI
jgi:hypothetical protein